MQPESIQIDTSAARLRRMRQSVLTSARLMSDDLPRGGFRYRPAMVTLTYRTVEDWQPQHVRQFLQRVRMWAVRKRFSLRYVWVAELQQRGAVHYHCLFWLPFSIPRPDSRGWWPHGSSNCKWAKHSVGYLSKYCSKGNPHRPYPKGCRIHGCGGLSKPAARCRRWWMSPQAVRHVAGPQHDVRRAIGGGFVSRVTGEILPPQWGLVAVATGRVRLCRLPSRWLPLLPVAPSSLVEQREVAAWRMSQQGRGSS